MGSRRAAAGLALATLLVGVLAATATGRSAGPRHLSAPVDAASSGLDFGDAPDGVPTGYGNGAIGHFPSKLRSNGARAHIGQGLRLGVQLDAEPDARPPGQERDNDGIAFGNGVACHQGQLAVLVTLDKPAPPEGRTVYFNFWADWNLDGRWSGSDKCAAEHAISDLALLVPPGQRTVIFKAPLQIGRYTAPFWSRSILSATPLNRDDPTGDAGPGEVEDFPLPYLNPATGVFCGFAFLNHGQAGFAPIAIAPSLAPVKFTQVLSDGLPSWTAKAQTPGPRLPVPAGPLAGLIKFQSLAPDVDGPPRFVLHKVFGRVVPKKGFQRNFTCIFIVAHNVPVVVAGATAPPGPKPKLARYSFSGLGFSFDYGVGGHYSVSNLSGSACGGDPLKASWTISLTYTDPGGSHPGTVPPRPIFAGGNPGKAGAIVFPGTNGAPNQSVTYQLKYAAGAPPTMTLLTQPTDQISNVVANPVHAPVTVTPVAAC